MIEVWEFSLDTPGDEALLSSDEKARADRFAFDHLRLHFVRARSVLRTLAGRYLDLDPARVAFVYGPRGKPELAGDTDLRFNLSHSGGRGVAAFARGCAVGVDVEQIREVPEMRDIAARYFSETEIRELGFFSCWTRKEAYIKAVGDGFAIPLHSFSVSQSAISVPGWNLYDLELGPDYAGAAVYSGPQRELKRYSF